jgi:hypothetical protein
VAIISTELLTDEEVLGNYDIYDLDRSDGELLRTTQFGTQDQALLQINFGIISTPEAPTSDSLRISYEPNSSVEVPLLRHIVINQVDGYNDAFQVDNVTMLNDKPVN